MTQSTLFRLAQSPNPHDRQQAAQCTAATWDTLSFSITDRDPLVRGLAARNPQCPMAFRLILVRDRHPWVRQTALAALSQ